MRDDLLGAIEVGTIDPSVSMDAESIETIVKSGGGARVKGASKRGRFLWMKAYSTGSRTQQRDSTMLYMQLK
jgi:hypothetical protein